MTAKVDVATLVAQMNDALASIHSTIEGLSTSAAESDTKLDELEQKRDMTLAELKAAYEKEQEELAAARQKELEEIAEQRRREDEEREARRRREDEERAARKAKEDEEKHATFDTTTRNVEDEMDDLMDNIEEETAKKIAEGEAKLAELEEKRKELNRLIEEQMKAAVPPIPTRKRARTLRKPGAVASAEPSPLPPAETPAESAPRDQSVEEKASKPSEEPTAGKESAAEESSPEAPLADEAPEDGVAAPADNGNGAVPEKEAKESTPQPLGELTERAMTGENDAPRSFDEAQANAPAEEDKGLEGEDSQPQSEEPVAEKSVEEGISTEETQPSEVTPPPDTAASEAKEATKDETSTVEPATKAVLPADASKPEREPEPEPTKDLEEVIPEAPANSAAAATTEALEHNSQAEAEDTIVESQSSVPAEEKDETEQPDATSENVPAEATPAAEEPSIKEPEVEEPSSAEMQIAEETSVRQESHAVEESALGEAPDVKALEVDATAEEASTADATTMEAPNDPAAGEAPAEDATEIKEAPASDESNLAEAAETDAPTEEHANAPEPSTDIEEQQKESTAPDDNLAEEQPANQSEDAAPESSLAEKHDDTLEVKEEQAAGEDVEESTKERSMPEFSMKAVVDEDASGEAHAADSTEAVVEEARPETDDINEHAEVDSNEARDVSEADSKAVEGEPSQEVDTAVDRPSDLDEAAFAEETEHEENTTTPEAPSAEPEEPAGAITEERDETPKEALKESDTTATEDEEHVPSQDAAPASEGVANELDVPEHEDAQEGEESILQDTTQAESSKELESPTVDATPVHDDTLQEDAAAPMIQTPQIVSAYGEAPSSEEPTREEHSLEQENDHKSDASLAEDKASAIEEDNHEDAAAAEDAVMGDESAGEHTAATEETSTKEVASDEERAKPTDDESFSEVQAGPEKNTEGDGAEAADDAEELEPAEAKDTAAEPSSEASPTQDLSGAQPGTVAQMLTHEPGETAEKKSLDEEAAQDASSDKEPKDNAAIEENLSDGQLAEEHIVDAPTSDASKSQDDGDLQDTQDIELVHAKEVSEQESSAAENEVQTRPDSQDAPVEVSELPPTTQEEEEHLPTAASKDLEDGDSKHRDTPHSPKEQFAGSVTDAAEDDSAVGTSDATTHAPASVNLTDGVGADGRAQASDLESQAVDTKLEVGKDVQEEASSASPEEDQDKTDNSAFLETQVEVEKGQLSGSEDDEDLQESRYMPKSAGHAPDETYASEEAEQTEKVEVSQTTTEGPDHHETQSSLADELHDDELKETAEGHGEVPKSITAHEETTKAVVDDEDPAQEAEVSDDEEEAHGEIHMNDSHQHDSHSAANATEDSQRSSVDVEPESTQSDSHHAEVEVLDPSRDDVSFDDAAGSREADLSVITEHTEPAASAAGDISEVAAKSEEHFHPGSVSRNVSVAPDAALDSSYMTETTSMAADQSYEQDQHHGGFVPPAGALGRNENGFISADRAHLDEEEDDRSSSVQSVTEDSVIDDFSEASYNPFARGNAASYEQPAYQSSEIPYNPFALQTVVEEEPPQETLNPFATKTADDATEAPYNPFARNTTSAADNFLRSASALSHNQPSSPEQSFARSASAQGHHDSVGSNNPFAGSMTPSNQDVLPTTTPLGQQDVAHFSNNPFARPVSAQGHYESEESDTDDEEALAAAESTYKNLFPVRHSPPMANDDLAYAAQNIERRQPTPQVPESAYSNSYATRGSPVGVDVAESRFNQGFSSPTGEHDYSFADVDGSVSPNAQQFAHESSPLSARQLAPTSLDSIQERYNSELEDMDSDSEEPESLTTSQQLPASQHRAIPPMPSIAERSFQDFEDSDEEEDWESRGPQSGIMDKSLASPEYRPSPPPPPPRSPNSHKLYAQEMETSSEDDGDIFRTNPAQAAQPSTISSSQYSATPPSPPPRAFSSQEQYSQQQEPEDSSEGEQNEWDDDFTPVQPRTLPFSQSGATPPRPPPPRAPSSFSQTQLHVEDSDEEDEVVLPVSIAQPNIPIALSSSENRAAPPPPPPPRAPSSQGLYNQEHQDSSEDEAPRSQNIARPGQFPFSSSSHTRATPPPPPPPRATSSHGQYRQNFEDSDDEEDAWDSKATLPGQIPAPPTSQYVATAPPPPPPRVLSAQDSYRQGLEDSDSEENKEAWEANRYGQTTKLMGASSPTESNQMAQTNMTESVSKGSVPATSSRDLPSHQREEGGEESDDSWENLGQRGDMHAVDSADRASAASKPQLRVDGYEQQWSNASNDQISTASTYLQQSGPGDFTDTESQAYATPLPSAGFSASSQYTQGAMDSPRHPESAGLKNTYDQSYNRGVTSPSYGQDVSFGQESSLADELARGDDSDSDVSEYDHTQAPAFLIQVGASQQQRHSDEPVREQVVTSFHGHEDDGPKTAVISDDHPAQYASARFGATSWRDELRSPTLFGATRHSRSGSLREEIQKSLHQEADSSYPSSPQSAHRPELPTQDLHKQEQSQVPGEQVLDQQPELYGQDLPTPKSSGQHPYGQMHLETQPFGLAGGSWGQPQAQSAQPTASQPELRVKVPDAEAEDDNEHRTPHLAPQQSEQALDISPLALRQESPATPSSRGTPSRGLAFSRHNPERPQTPPTQTATEGDIDHELIVPRDVTNVPWHARTDSVPYSVQSQSTIDSLASSPVHSALHADKHEPVIRDSWPASMHNLTRPRNDSTLTDRDDYDPFKYEGGAKPMRGPSGSVGSSSDSPLRDAGSNNSPGSLISRMRGIFENSQTKQEPASPSRSRPVSGVFHPVQRTKPGGGDESPGYERKAGFLNEAEDEVDEQSALLRSSAGGLEAN